MTTSSGTSPEETKQPIRSLNPIPTALHKLIPSDGYYDLMAYDLSTKFITLHTARLRKDTKGVPTFSSHIPGNPDVLIAKYEYRIDAIGNTKNEVIIDRMKESLYSEPEATEKMKDLAVIAHRIPYLKDRYINAEMNDHPEIWLPADYILWLTNLVISDGTIETGESPI